MWCVPSAGRCVRFTGCCAEGSFGLGYQWSSGGTQWICPSPNIKQSP